MENSKYMLPKEVASLFEVSTRTVTRWADRGAFTVVKTPGGHRRFIREEVVAAAEQDCS
ncbi:helix-turn-helix domain-containing protein [Streptomyces griseus]|uniref:helix-turn-helix domain-containing protein n=1 Tax=Streptomyces griseus TaxID=1911 RepID=UPI0033D594A5